MDLKVKDLLAMEPLKDAEVLGGQQYTHNLIEGVTIMEGPDIADWIKGGEVILTSLYSIQDFDEKELREFTAKLAEKRVSALIIKKPNEEISDQLIQAGENSKCQSSSFRKKFLLSISCIPSWGSFSIIRS